MAKRPIQLFMDSCRDSSLPPAVVFGASVNGLSYVRSLGWKGVPVLVVDSTVGTASKSRFGQFICLDSQPNEEISGEQAATRILDMLHETGRNVVALGTSDEWQVYLSGRADAVDCTFVSLVPKKETIDLIVDKQAQYEFATAHGIPVPVFANAAEILDDPRVWSHFPAIVKPRWAHSGRRLIGGKAVFAESQGELQNRLVDLKTKAHPEDYLVQKAIRGQDDSLYAFLGCFDQDGREFSFVLKRKLRQYPPLLGDGSFDATCDVPEVADIARRLLAPMRYSGLVGIEFKRDADTGKFELIEINPRSVSTNQLAVTAGVDFPWQAYQLALHSQGRSTVPLGKLTRQYRVGVHHLHEERDVRGFMMRWKAGQIGLWEWLRSISRTRSFAMWKLDDPWPFVCAMVAALTKIRPSLK